MNEDEKREWRKKHEAELEQRMKKKAMGRQPYYSERWHGYWFQEVGGGHPVPYSDVVRKGKDMSKRQIDESLDSLVASGRLVAYTKEQLNDYMDKDITQLVEKVIEDAGDKGLTQEDILERVGLELDRREMMMPVEPVEAPKVEQSYEERFPRVTMFKKLLAEGVDGEEAKRMVDEKYGLED